MTGREGKNDGCRQCRHFRTYKPLSQIMIRGLKAGQSTTLLSEFNRFISAESERRDGETRTRVEVVEQGRMEWPLRPSMSDYCGEREDESVFFLHEVRNAERTCKAFERRDGDLVYCESCLHLCEGTGWIEDQQDREGLNKTLSGGVDEQSIAQAAQLFQRHQDLVDQRKLSEANRCLYGLRFSDEPPRYLAYCAAYSREDDYVPCLLRNAHNRCPRFTDADAPEARKPTNFEKLVKETNLTKGFFE